MTLRFRSTLITSLVLGLAACALGAQDLSLGERRRELPARKGPRALSGHDRADARRDWNLFWFGGRPSPEQLDAKGRLAAQEARRWEHTLPRTPGSAFLLTPPAVGGTWVNLGPTANLTSANFPDIDSGRPVAVVAHPTVANTLFLATSGGGVFKCENADPASTSDWTWTPITDGLPYVGASGNISVGAFAVNPANGALILGLGDAFDAEGRGIYTSADGGATWVAATGIRDATRVASILPLDANRILVGTNDGLKLSLDGGATFSPVAGALGTTGTQIWSVKKLTATRLIASIASGSNGSIYYSDNAGDSWTLATISGMASPGRITLGTSAASSTIAWGMAEDTSSSQIGRGLLKTTDGGATWTFVAAPSVSGGLFQGIGNQMSSDGSQAWYNHGFAVDPNNANQVFMGANLALYRTTDGGQNWTQLTHWYGHRHVYAHADFHCSGWSTNGSVLFIGNDGGLAVVRDPFRSSVPTGSSTVNSDITFIDNTRNKGLTTHLIYNIGSTIASSPADSRHRITLGLQDNGTRVRQPIGGTTEGSGIFEDRIGGDGFGTVIHPTNGNLMLGTVYYTQVEKSVDGGASSFSSATTGIAEAGNSGSAPFAPKIALGAASTPDTVYTFVNTKVYKSTNFGDSWTAMGTTGLPAGVVIRNINASRSNPQSVIAALNGGRVAVTYNGGSSWVTSADLTAGGYNTSYVSFNTESDQTLYLASVAENTSKHHLWKSTNGGSSWTPLDGAAGASNGFPFGIPVHVIQNVPGQANHLFAGTDFGVYRSTDGGASWERFGQGLPMVAVRDLYLAPDASFVRAGTYGRGVWEISLASNAVAVAMVPSTAVQVNPGATTTFKATVTNASNNQVNWTVSTGGGSVSPTTTAGDGLATTTYTAPATVGTYTVTATSVEDGTKSAATAVNVYNPAAVTVAVTPTAKTLVTGGTHTFTALASNVPSAGTFTWSVSAGGGSINAASGAYTAPATAGTYTVTATSSWSGVTGTATVTVKTLDMNADTVVDTLDILQMAKRMGSTVPADLAAADLNGDGAIDDADLTLLLNAI